MSEADAEHPGTPDAGLPGTGPPAVPDVRASDADRERIAQRVREAVGDGRLTVIEGDERLAATYAARYRRELEPVVADLGGLPAELADEAPARGGSAPAPPGGRPSTTSSVAVMGGAARTGDWIPGATHVAVAVMGGVELDLRSARLDRQGLLITAVAVMGSVTVDLRGIDPGPDPVVVRGVALMGGVELRVDPTTRVENHGFAIMGGVDPGRVPQEPAPGTPTPVVRIEGLAVMGGFSVVRSGPGELPR